MPKLFAIVKFAVSIFRPFLIWEICECLFFPYLYEAPPADAGLHEGLCDPAGGVGGGAVHLGVVLKGGKKFF